MSKHTPGPWGIYLTSDEDGKRWLSVSPSSVEVGAWADGICHVSEESKVNDSDRANARLIAAAPDLLEACEGTSKAPKEALAIMEREGFVIDNLDDRWQKLAFTLYSMLVNNASIAEAAIAKAEGRP